MLIPGIFNPLHTLSRVFVLNMIRRIAPQTILTIVTTFVSSIYTILPTLGYIRSFQILLRVREALNLRVLPRALKDILFRNTNPIAAQTIYSILEPNWNTLLKNFSSFKKIINILFFVFCFVLILQPFTIWLIRLCISAILSAIGIIYTPALKTIKFLKKYSTYVLAFLPFDIVPKGVKESFIPIREIINEPIAESKIKKVGLSIIAALAIILLIDYFKPETPGIEPIATTTKSVLSYGLHVSQVISIAAASPFVVIYSSFIDPILPINWQFNNV